MDYPLQTKITLQRNCRCNLNLQQKFYCNLKLFATDYPLQMKITLQWIFHCKFKLQRKIRCNLKPFATDCPLQMKIAFQNPLSTCRFPLFFSFDFQSSSVPCIIYIHVRTCLYLAPFHFHTSLSKLVSLFNSLSLLLSLSHTHTESE